MAGRFKTREEMITPKKTDEAKAKSDLMDLLSLTLSFAVITDLVMKHHYDGCKIPPEYKHMITDIVSAHMLSLGTALGNLEICYRRTKDEQKT